MAFINTVVGRAAASIWGLKLGNATMNAVLAQVNVLGANDAAVAAVFMSASTVIVAINAQFLRSYRRHT